MARDKVIVYNGDDGKCRVVIPTYDCALADDAVIAKDIPTAEYSVLDPSALPDKTFRNAWTYNHSSLACGCGSCKCERNNDRNPGESLSSKREGERGDYESRQHERADSRSS